ncbi:MAG: MurR/RpiR family transcriptional regulator [Calditrichales bacterium]|nr:MAG: MurR/RpiR family transcriptional regulator [Calditrichales bacterium]
MRYEKLKHRIQHAYNDLPRNQQNVADFILENFDRIPFQGIQSISKSTSASVATIVRFAQRIGFSGFSELREQIAETLQNHIENKEIFVLSQDSSLSGDILTSVAKQDISNINETLAALERTQFDSAVDLILNASRVFTMGLGISNLMSQILAYQLNQIGYQAQAFRHDCTYFTEQVVFLQPKDILIGFSFPPYSKETIKAAEAAAADNIPVISITNRSTSPITNFSRTVLCVKSENMLFTNSFAAISVLINALSTECARRDEAHVRKMVERIDSATKEQNQVFI